MPRPKPPNAPAPKRRSRTGCWNCKSKKIKCDERHPSCLNCERNGEKFCDYSIRLNWEGRAKRKDTLTPEIGSPALTPDLGPGTPGLDKSTTPLSRMISTIDPVNPIDPAIVLAEMPLTGRDSAQKVPQFSKFRGYVPPKPTPRSDPRPLSSGSSKRKSAPDDNFDDRYDTMSNSRNVNLDSMATILQSPKKARTGSAAPLNDIIAAAGKYPASVGSSDPDRSPSSVQFNVQTPDANIRRPLSSPGSSLSNDGGPAPFKSPVISHDGRSRISTPSSLPLNVTDEPRRLSVNSLLIQEEAHSFERRYRPPRSSFDQTVCYGIDRGVHDRDIPDNDDAHSLDIVTPTLYSGGFDGESDDEISTEFGFGLSSNKVASYDGDIQVRIPKSLNPLPALLHANPMNLMYFHFFIQFTARILVPHDCPANPFKVILPQMAVRDESLLHLLLAYAASHRARLLGHAQPSNRIALWVRDVFPKLRHALEDPTIEVSSANVATAIMLASLEIIAPSTFGIEIPWQDHLNTAREMIYSRARSGNMGDRRDKVSHFLIRWFAYLDVLGNFSSVGMSKHNIIFSGDLYDFGKENEFSIDCLLGFSGYLAGILAKIADLARHCDRERVNEKGEINEAWEPPPPVVQAADKIKDDLARARVQKFTTCPHRPSSTEQETAWESMEMAALNEAFHWAGMVHLYRRVLGMHQDSAEVQSATREIVITTFKVREGGSAEACLIFPLFTAGCEAKEESQRNTIFKRIKSVEESGMTQVQKARRLLERVWSTGKPWETLVHGEFFG